MTLSSSQGALAKPGATFPASASPTDFRVLLLGSGWRWPLWKRWAAQPCSPHQQGAFQSQGLQGARECLSWGNAPLPSTCPLGGNSPESAFAENWPREVVRFPCLCWRESLPAYTSHGALNAVNMVLAHPTLGSRLTPPKAVALRSGDCRDPLPLFSRENALVVWSLDSKQCPSPV